MKAKERLKELKHEWDATAFGIKMDAYYEGKREPGNAEAKALAFLSWIGFALARPYCRVFGHKPVDNGYAGPESGCVDVYCERCGASLGFQWLY